MPRNSQLFSAAVAALGFAALQCGGDPNVNGNPLAPPDITGGGCDAAKSPAEGGCEVSDASGIFVSPAGADTNPGTKAAPLKTVQAGVNAAKKDANKRNVFVCEGTYDEQIVIDDAAQGIALHGGFGCGDWAYGAKSVVLAPSKAGVVVKVAGSAGLLETFELRAKDGDVPGASSIVVFVEAAPGMTFRRTKVFAGKGAAGKAGDSAAPFSVPALDGNDAAGGQPAPQRSCSCGSSSSVGGSGGGGTPGVLASAGTPTIAGADATAGKPFSISSSPCNGAGGPGAYDGASGLAGDVVKGASTIGTLASQGWKAEPGQPGKEGGVAQGGGGGAGLPTVHVSSGGGCGGCGGKAGGAGEGGGASIGIAALNSTLRVQSSTITTADGGDGGKGGDGAVGQVGGKGGGPDPVGYPWCKGGAGGKGGDGSGGGGGAGGSSLGIVVVGSKELDVDKASSFTIGSAKPGGAGGGPKGATGGFGIDGFAAAILGNK